MFKPFGYLVVKELIMNNEKKLAEKFGRKGGMNAPEGFLEDVFARVREQRGELPKMAVTPETTRWQRLRPYVYLAAMFAGIWCMMKLFTIAQNHTLPDHQTAKTENVISLDNPPQLLAEAVTTPEVASELAITADVSASPASDYELEKDVEQAYNGDFAEFEEAFDYEFEEQYADIDIDKLVAQVPTEPSSEPKNDQDTDR